ncbi:hypothetical protein ACWG0Q_24815 [Actinacidiphila sp. SB3-2]
MPYALTRRADGVDPPRRDLDRAARTKASTAPFALEAALLVGIGSRASTPVISVNEPRSATYRTPCRTSSIWLRTLPRNADS